MCNRKVLIGDRIVLRDTAQLAGGRLLKLTAPDAVG